MQQNDSLADGYAQMLIAGSHKSNLLNPGFTTEGRKAMDAGSHMGNVLGATEIHMRVRSSCPLVGAPPQPIQPWHAEPPATGCHGCYSSHSNESMPSNRSMLSRHHPGHAGRRCFALRRLLCTR